MKTNEVDQWLRNRGDTSATVNRVVAAVFVAVMIPIGLLLHGHYAEASASTASSQNTKQYDPVVLPISDAAVREGLIRDSVDAQAEYQLLLRAGYQHKEKTAYQTMNRLRREQPKNPVVLAGYFMAFRMAEGGVNTIPYNGGRQVLTFTSREEDEAASLLQQAYRLAPKLWLTYAVDGEDKFYVPGGDKKQALALLQKAEELAPDNPYTHWLLGDAYTSPPISQHKYEMAAEECKKALASGARISSAAFTLVQIYNLWTPNRVEAIKWKRKFLSLVPLDVKINPDAKQMLNRYPG